jgi:predicted transcriptional regulator
VSQRITKRQAEALAWLESVGKATAKLARQHGFQARTLDALADAGLIRREYMPRTFGGPYPVYRMPPPAESNGG